MNAEQRKAKISAMVQAICDDVSVPLLVREAFIALADELTDLRKRVIELQNK